MWTRIIEQTTPYNFCLEYFTGLSVLDLCLIISMKQLNEVYSDEPFTFQMVYEHYKKFSQSKSSMRAYPRAIATKSFEHLIDLELVKPTDRNHSVPKQYWPMRMLVTSKEIDEAVLRYNGCPSEVKLWASSNWVHWRKTCMSDYNIMAMWIYKPEPLMYKAWFEKQSPNCELSSHLRPIAHSLRYSSIMNTRVSKLEALFMFHSRVEQ